MISSQDFRRFLSFNNIKFKEIPHKNNHIEFYFSVGESTYYKRSVEVIFMPNVTSIYIQVSGIDVSFLSDKGREFFEKGMADLNANQGVFKFSINPFDEAFAYTEYPNENETTLESLKCIIDQGLYVLYLLDEVYDMCFDVDEFE